ncbi:MAG TPA: HAD family hydrolase [Candidatus Eisenbacteria bacterium]|nr:HAD family hydrolase [Candidatus Eisenbacteria bacterium]
MASISDTTGGAHRGRAAPPDLLGGIELIVFDKDGTLIDFQYMWTGWLASTTERLEIETGLALGAELHGLMGVDPASGVVLPHGLLAATPMARIHERVVDLLVGRGQPRKEAARAVAAAWRAPDPVTLARPVTNLGALFSTLRMAGRRLAIATTDDRLPTERTLDALGIAGLIDAVACADDGQPVKPAPDAVLTLCAALGVPPARTAVVGDAPADLRMGRAAGAGRVIGVLTGVGDTATLQPLADVVLESVADLAPSDRTR